MVCREGTHGAPLCLSDTVKRRGGIFNIFRFSPARQFELFDDIGYFLEAMNVAMFFALFVGNDEECRTLEQKHLHDGISSNQFYSVF